MTSDAVSLRRACQACVSSKRRCDRSSPKCSRCSARGIDCAYINAPLTDGAAAHTAIASRVAPNRLSEVDSAHRYRNRMLAMTYSQLPPSPSSQAEIVKTLDQVPLQQLILGMQSFPRMFVRQMKTSFLHPQLYGSDMPHALQDMRMTCNLYFGGGEGLDSRSFFLLLRQKVKDLLKQAEQAPSFEILLSCVQALVLALCIELFDFDNVHREHAYDRMMDFAYRLWQQAPIQLSSSWSPWRAWLFAETVRRTIIICNMLRTTYSQMRRRYSIRTPFVDALPFDSRTPLWDLMSEESWQSISSSTSIALVSLHEYSAMLATGGASHVSVLDNLILVACKGNPIPQKDISPEMIL
jgi:hypothetical protein